MERDITYTLAVQTSFVTETCYACGVAWGMLREFKENRLGDKKPFYCPNGHSQHYTGKSLREQLDEAQGKVRLAEARSRSLEDDVVREAEKLTRLRKRIGKGVCPSCKRQFQNVSRHMKSKHPSLAAP